jgi:hypothetical protein
MSYKGPVEEGYVIEPEVLKVLVQLFGAEWELIRPAFEGRQQALVDAARNVVARLVLHIARNGVTDSDTLRDQLHRMVHHVYAEILRPIRTSSAASRTAVRPPT